jgi:flagella basal body P-ring formation protein FlgA
MSTTTARYAGVLARASLLPLSMLLPLAAAAQSATGQDAPDGMIMIPGNGEPAAAAPRGVAPGKPRGMTPATPARAADADATFENAARNAQIVIPGNGEPVAQVSTVSQATVSQAPAEPSLHPAVAALLAEHNAEPAAPRSALVQLQKQAATELGQDAAAHGATSDAAPDHALSLVNAPTARSMPSLQTIAPGQILGAVRPPGSRAQSVVVSTPPKSDPATRAQDAVQPVSVASEAVRAQAKGPKEIPVNVATTVPANAPPIAHSVTVVTQQPAAVVAVSAAPALPGKQDPAVIMKTAEDFLRQQATGLPGHVTLTIPPIAPRGLVACDNLQAFMAPGAPMWGRTTVGVRCTGEKPWTIYLVARVSVQATYYVAGRSISPGDVIQMADLVPREGDLSVMPRAIVTDPSQVIGAVAENRISAGLPLRSDLIRSPQAIQLGQTVKIVAQGDGFSISTDGSAMNNASPGQQVRVKTSTGQMVVGTASGKGVVQIPM